MSNTSKVKPVLKNKIKARTSPEPDFYVIQESGSNHCASFASRIIYKSKREAIDAHLIAMRDYSSTRDVEIDYDEFGFSFTDKYDHRFRNNFIVKPLYIAK